MSNDSAAVLEQSRGHSNSINPPNSTKLYPKPEADYHQIAQNPDFFLQKLQSFHTSFGTKFKIPTIGGKTLDLHHLFVEVTSRGGIEKVITDRKWKEVTGTFKFPSSITSASFVLRKYYLSLLYHFEQVYYLRKEAPSVSQESASQIVNWSAPDNPEDGAMIIQYSGSADLEDGSLVNGTIDAKFDYGYLITVDLGFEKLKGVLYHTPTPKVSTSSAPRKRRRHRSTDPSRPKRSSSGYNFFFAEHYNRLQPSHHQGEEKSIAFKNIGVLWNRLSDAEKQVYQERAKQDKERYKAEMLAYKSSHQ